MLTGSLETQADQRNTRATLYDVWVGSEGGGVGVSVPEGQLGEDSFSYTCRVGMGRDPWVRKCSLGLSATRLLPPLLYTGNHRYISVPILVPFPGIY